MAVYWKCCRPATIPGTYFTSISTSSPGATVALIYAYFISLLRYLRTNPSRCNIAPIVRGGTTNPSFFICQCSFNAHFLVCVRNVIMCSLMRMGVSRAWVFRAVDRGTSPSAPAARYVATHRSSVRFPYGNTFATSTSFASFLTTGSTHRSRSSFIVLTMCIAIAGYYPETAICACTLPRLLDI